MKYMYMTHLLLCLAIVYPVNGISVKLGMLMPLRHPRLGWENNAAAATIAVERAQGMGLLVGHNIRYYYFSFLIPVL